MENVTLIIRQSEVSIAFNWPMRGQTPSHQPPSTLAVTRCQHQTCPECPLPQPGHNKLSKILTKANCESGEGGGVTTEHHHGDLLLSPRPHDYLCFHLRARGASAGVSAPLTEVQPIERLRGGASGGFQIKCLLSMWKSPIKSSFYFWSKMQLYKL